MTIIDRIVRGLNEIVNRLLDHHSLSMMEV